MVYSKKLKNKATALQEEYRIKKLTRKEKMELMAMSKKFDKASEKQ